MIPQITAKEILKLLYEIFGEKILSIKIMLKKKKKCD